MKKSLLLCGIFSLCLSFQSSAQDIITSTPEGTLHSTVYGSTKNTYLVAEGGLGSFANNDGYNTQIVINGNDFYVHNVIREYPGMNCRVKGTLAEDGTVDKGNRR